MHLTVRSEFFPLPHLTNYAKLVLSDLFYNFFSLTGEGRSKNVVLVVILDLVTTLDISCDDNKSFEKLRHTVTQSNDVIISYFISCVVYIHVIFFIRFPIRY